MSNRTERKGEYFGRLTNFLNEYTRIFIVQADNVGSSQQIRRALRGTAEVLMGKNTMIRKCIRDLKDDTFSRILPHVRGNIGFVFTNEDLKTVRDVIQQNKVPAPARVGAIAPLNVTVPAGNTGMEPTKTSFFQALGIPTKITKGTVEIISDVLLLKKGDKVDQSQAELLKVMNIKPFSYGLTILQVYDSGSVFAPHVLDITDEDIASQFSAGISNLAAVSLQIGYPTVASLPHSIITGFRNILAIAVETAIDIPAASKIKEYLADPSKFAVAAAPVAAAAAPSGGKAAAKAAEPEPEEEEEEEMGMGLFD